MKCILFLAGACLMMPACRMAHVTRYDMDRYPRENCFYQIEMAGSSFREVEPIVSTDTEQVWNGDQWVIVDEEDVVVGYSVRNGALRSFQYFLEKGLNTGGYTERCGTVRVTRVHAYSKRDISPGLSILTLFIPNILGLPVRSCRVDQAYLFEVYDVEGRLIYRDVHAGAGKAKLGLYYGWKNTQEKAEYDAAYAAVTDFLLGFDSR